MCLHMPSLIQKHAPVKGKRSNHHIFKFQPNPSWAKKRPNRYTSFRAEKKVYAFQAVFGVDVSDVNPFQNPTEMWPFDHFLDPQSMPRLFQTINRWLIQA